MPPAKAGALAGLLLPAPQDLLLIAALLAPVFVHLPDYDSWWHLKAGADVLASGGPAPGDAYSFTMTGQRWFQHEWLPEAALAFLAARFGLDVLLLVKAVCLAGTIALAWVAAGPRLRRYPLARLLVAILALASLVPTLTPRPWMISFLLFLLVVVLWEDERLPAPASTVLLALVLAVWMNLHGMYAVGYVWLGLQAAGAAADLALGSGASPSRHLARPAAAMALGTLGAAVHPFGLDILAYPFQYHFGKVMRVYIVEWFPPDTNSAYGRFLLVSAAFTLFCLARAGAPPSAWLSTAVLAYLAFTSRRNVPLFTLGTLPATARAFAAVLERPRAVRDGWRGGATRFLWRRFDNFNAVAREQARSKYWVPTLAGLALFFLVLNPRAGAADALFETEGLARLCPVEATRYLLARPDVERRRIFNFYAWGGYLIHEGAPRIKTFIDGRADLFGLALFEDYQAVAGMSPRWRAILARHGVDTILFPADHPLRQLLVESGEWRLAHEDGTAVVFERIPAPARAAP